MSMVSGFFNARRINGVYDNVYDAEDFANYFRSFVSDGVFGEPTNQLKVVSKEGLTVTVKPGKCWIKGYWGTLSTEYDITFNPNTTGGTINNVIACVLNPTKTNIDIVKLENVSSMLRTEDSLVLASFSLNPGQSTITTAMITDRRPDVKYCGFVTGVVKQLNYQEVVDQTQAQFNEWFEAMKDQLSEDAAGNLQQQIDKMKQDMPTKLTDLENDLPIVSIKNNGLVEKNTYEYEDSFGVHRWYNTNCSWGTDENGTPMWIPDRQHIQLNTGGTRVLEGGKIIYASPLRYGELVDIFLSFTTVGGTSAQTEAYWNHVSIGVFSMIEIFMDVGLYPNDKFNDVGGVYYGDNVYTRNVEFRKIDGTLYCTAVWIFRWCAKVVSDDKFPDRRRVDYGIQTIKISKTYASGFSDSVTGFFSFDWGGWALGQNSRLVYKRQYSTN